MTIRFDWVTTAAGLDGLRDAWSALDDGAAPGAVFRSWEWQATWWRHLGDEPARRAALRILVARDDRAVRAILPMYVEDAPVAGLVPRRRLGFLGDGVVGSDYLGIIGDIPPEALARAITSEPILKDVDLVELADLLEGDRFGEVLGRQLSAAGWHEVAVVPRHLCPYARLVGQDLERYLAARPNGFGGQLRARRRALEKCRGFDLQIAATPDEVAEGLGTLFALHRLRWAADGGSDAITSARVEEFHRAAGRALAARGFARLAILRAEGSPVAAGYGFTRGGRFVYYQAGMDPAWRKRSAGLVVLGALIERAFAERLEEFDFLRGDEPYKAIWADAARATAMIRATPPRPSARLAARAQRALTALRRRAHDALPPAAVRLARAVRRRIGHG